MTPEDFRKRGHDMVDWIADYLANVTRYPVNSQVEPGAIRGALPDAAPEQPEPFEDVIRDLNEIIMPGITHWQSPNWFSYFPANSSGPSILGEMVAAGLGVQGMLWSTHPAATEWKRRGGLDGRSARSPRSLEDHRTRRRGHPDERFGFRSRSPGHRPRAGAAASGIRPPGGVRLRPDPLVGGEGRPHRRLPPLPVDRDRRRLCHGPDCFEERWPPIAPTGSSPLRCRHRRHHRHHAVDPIRTIAGHRQETRACGCTSMRRTPARR